MTKIPKINNLKCAYCSKEFYRGQWRINYGIKRGDKSIVCSKSCGTKLNNPNPNPIDEYSPFKYFVRAAKTRSKKKNLECTITIDDLKKQWEKQGGLCVLSGVKMDLITHGGMKRKHDPIRASIDRINSKLGYTPDNIRFVTYMINCAKNRFEDNDFHIMCEAVVNHQKKPESEPFPLAF